jgi:pyridoxamine 5'-phosphate oxidase
MAEQDRGLDERDVDPDPFAQFSVWFDEARASGNPQPDAMALATATRDGRPSVRMVILKEVDRRGLIFYTNYRSQKGLEMEANRRAAVVLSWPELHRQVRVTGTVELLSREESDAYFRTRPRDAQLSAVISRQTVPVESRAILEQRYAEAASRYPGQEVPLPEDWGGIRVVPEMFEFWQGRPSRLHDRLRYVRAADGSWTIERLQP